MERNIEDTLNLGNKFPDIDSEDVGFCCLRGKKYSVHKLYNSNLLYTVEMTGRKIVAIRDRRDEFGAVLGITDADAASIIELSQIEG